MALTPVPCACGGGGGGGGTGEACCAPSITSTPLCRPDCSTIIVVVQSGCADCGAAPTAPEVLGWVDPATGVFTAGPAPADAQPCDGCGCVDTICVTRCDDTTGDGTADTTFSELWCVHPDGTTDLILTYQNDPSTPYTPVSPVDCTMACPESETVMLCDVSGPFLRRYTFLNGQASFEDVALDGQTPHVVIGTVRACSGGEDCEQPTTPAATIGLCLADGTPIAVVVTRDCEGVITQQGWLNLTTGDYAAGNPPAGTMACGDSQSIQTSGVFCDVDANGDVVGLVLVEYTYAADGSISSVRLVDATTGQTYTTQGEITACPVGVEQPEQDLVILCDVAADGTVASFVRDFRRDENGAISGHSDYTLDGAAYTPTGAVGVCEEPCRNSTTLLVCDLPTGGAPVPSVTDTDPRAYRGGSNVPLAGGGATLWSGGTLTIPADTAAQPDSTGTVRTIAARIQAPRPGCDTGTAHITVTVDVEQLGPSVGCAATGFLFLYNGTSPVTVSAPPNNTAIGWTGTLTVQAGVPAADVAAGSIAVVLGFDTYENNPGPCPGQRQTSWELSEFAATVIYDQTGCEKQILRTVTVDCEMGTVTSVEDATLDGQPYTVVGEVGQCAPASGGGACCPPPEPEPCRNTSTLLLCDLPGDGEPAPAVADTNPAPYDAGTAGADPLPGGAAALWSGGVLTIPPDTTAASDGTVQRLRSFAATVRAPRPGCDTGTATVTASIRVEREGPDPGCAGTGVFALIVGGTQVATAGVTPSNIPVGTVRVLTVSAPVPAADLASGTVALSGRLETYHLAPGSCPGTGPGGARTGGWTVDDFTVSVAYDQAGCAAQVFANVVTDCETGQVQSVTYTLPDGTPYEPQGTIGQCTPASTPGEPCAAQNVIQAQRCDDTTGDGLPDVEYVELLAVDCEGALTSLGTYTCTLDAPYTPVSPVDCHPDSEPVPQVVSGVQARRVELAPGATWTAAAYGTLRAVSATAHNGTGTVTTTDGTSTLFAGETATWSISKDVDARLLGPLAITAATGTVTVTYTTGVDL
ncbi:hypothetical protein ABZ568_00475 [Streptomyces olindensis]|uniref:Uncharacterized protein n=1 Tax=Streptomyces olindensis TaxID=358823 RepID=A0ABV2XLS0_9ACTN